MASSPKRVFIISGHRSPTDFHDRVERDHGRVIASRLYVHESGNTYGAVEVEVYEPPTLIPIGNLNDLLSMVCQHGHEET